jgi:excisionase family DNA binding protein
MAGVREKLLTASDLATLCEVDLKTIHNWVDRGRIAHFRTPGRHLRFRAADVADFLRAWGYSVPRDLARASSRTMLVLGTKETVALVARALGEASPQPSGPTAPGGMRMPLKAGAPPGEQGAPKPPFMTGAPVGAPIRHAGHPYDALVYAGSDPTDVYIVDVRAVADDIDVVLMLEALHRASPQATYVALSDEPVQLPSFTTRVARGDMAALRSALGAEAIAAAPAAASAGGPVSAGSPATPMPIRPVSTVSSGKTSSAAISVVPAAARDEAEEDEEPPRGLAAGGSSR